MSARHYSQQSESYLVMEDNGKTQADLLLETHMKMGHFGMGATRKVLGMKAAPKEDDPPCNSCLIMRATKSKMGESERPRADRCLKRVWMDIGFGRMSKLVFQVYLDDYSKRLWSDKLKDKSATLVAWMALQLKLENDKYPLKVAVITRDNDPVYKAHYWSVYAKEHGVEQESYGPYRKESPMERAIQTVGGSARAFMHHGNAPETDMYYAIEHAIFCYNNRPHSANPNSRSPMSMWAGVVLKPSARMMKGVMFCLCYGFIYPEQRGKNAQRSFPAIFKGCKHNERSYRLQEISSGKHYQVCDVKFVCGVMPYRQQMPGRVSERDANYDDLEPADDDDLPLAAAEHLGRVR
jgi:hypothetical protein